MCGIVGFNWQDGDLIGQLTGLLAHRGPEQEGLYVGNGVSLGHRRLRIIDLSDNSRQPMSNEDGSIYVVYNGEIFNFQSLRAELERDGHRFRSKSDTEVLVHGYEQWGMGLLQRIRGQFAFCIWDSKDQCLVLARDHLGIKPLYFYSEGNRFIFGSELKVFLKADVPRQICKPALDYYLLFGNTPVGQSILQAVKKLQPGGYLIYDLKAARVAERGRYWQLRYRPDGSMTMPDVTKAIRDRLSAAVCSQLVSDVPLGAFLSGGLDSSAIVALMRPHVKELNTFSIRFDRPGYDESEYAKIASETFKTIHHQIQFDARVVRELIEQLPYYYDEPFADPSMIPTSLVSRVARQHVTVALSGTGGDELFAGYPRYQQIRLLLALNAMPGLLKHTTDALVAGINKIIASDILNKLRSFLGPKQGSLNVYLMLFSYMFRDRIERRIDLGQFDWLEDSFCYDDIITNVLSFDTQHYLPECLLTKEDRASMAVSLETRVPFLDLDLVELASRIPSRFKLKGLQKKYVLKKAMAGILPRQIIYRRKQGFGVPLAEYLRNELRDLAFDEVFAETGVQLYDRSLLEQAWQYHQSGRSDYSRLFWSVIMFNRWFKRWMQ